MISVCVPFYPWHRGNDRVPYVFDVLIDSMNKCYRSETLELVIIDAGVEELWGQNAKRLGFEDGRIHESGKFKAAIIANFNGDVRYRLAPECIKRSEEGKRAFWLSRAVAMAVSAAKHDKVFISGIDITLPVDFIGRYNDNVKPGEAWVVKAYAVPRGAPLKQAPGIPGFGWYGARGIVGILKDDYRKIGGYPWEDKVMRSSDSVFYKKIRWNLRLNEGPEQGFFHVGHAGSNFGNTRNWNWEAVKEKLTEEQIRMVEG
jgi:hypothetical protein